MITTDYMVDLDGSTVGERTHILKIIEKTLDRSFCTSMKRAMGRPGLCWWQYLRPDADTWLGTNQITLNGSEATSRISAKDFIKKFTTPIVDLSAAL